MNSVKKIAVVAAALSVIASSAIWAAAAKVPDMLISDAYLSKVYRFDGNTGEYKGVFVTEHAADSKCMAFGKDGNLYITCAKDGEVNRFDGKTGKFMDTFISGLKSKNGIAGIAFAPNGDLYLCDRNAGVEKGDGKVMIFDGKTGKQKGVLFEGWQPGAIFFGDDGRVYISDLADASLRSFNLDGSDPKLIADWQVSQQPYSIVEAKGKLYSINMKWDGTKNIHKVSKFDVNDKTRTDFVDEQVQRSSLALGANGLIYMLSKDPAKQVAPVRVTVYDQDGKKVDTLLGSTPDSNPLVFGTCVVFMPQ